MPVKFTLPKVMSSYCMSFFVQPTVQKQKYIWFMAIDDRKTQSLHGKPALEITKAFNI